MTSLLSLIDTSVGVVFAAVLNNLWLAILAVASAWLAMKFLSLLNAATRYVIWWAMLGVVVALPVTPHLGRWRSSQELPLVAAYPPVASNSMPTPNSAETPILLTAAPRAARMWPLWLFALWTAILAFRCCQLVRSYIFLRRVKHRASRSSLVLPGTGTCRSVRLLVSQDITSPMAVGFFDPAIVLPADLMDQLSQEELRLVLLHELAHLTRFDDWTNLAARFVGGLLALHPVAIWILRQVDREREMACDDFVVAHTGQPRTYAASLARLYEISQNSPRQALASGIFGPFPKLGDRIETVLRLGRSFSSRSSRTALVLSGSILLSLLIASTAAPHWIAFAQQLQKPRFEVASVKPNNNPPVIGSAQFQFLPGGRLAIRNMPVAMIAAVAYDVPLRTLALAGSEEFKRLAQERYDIEAVAAKDSVPASLSSRERQDRLKQMLQALLEERFKMAIRKEPKEQPVYALVVSRGGAKLVRSKQDCSQSPTGPMETCHGITGGIGRGIHGEAVTIGEVALFVQNWTDRPVVDKTGLTDLYNIQTEGWAPMVPQPAGPEGRQGGDVGLDDPLRPTLADIFRRFGLTLESQRAVVDTYVVDRIERPSAN